MFNIIPNLSDNFYKWFENSKVIDTNNQPMIMYHKSRSKEKFNEFRLENIEKNPYNYDYGIFFVNAHYSHYISYIGDGLEYYVFLKILNPFYIFDFNNKPYNMFGENLQYIDISKDYCHKLQEQLFDGIIIKSNYYDQYICFNSNQIKSVENCGNYKNDDNNIFN